MRDKISRQELGARSIQDIFSLLRTKGYMISNLAFEKLLADQYIDAHYAQSERFSENLYINRHDKTHALRVTSNSVKIYTNLVTEPSLLRFGDDPETGRPAFGFANVLTCRLYNLGELASQDLGCSCVLIASFCHDMYKFLAKDHPAAAALAVKNMAYKTLPKVLDPSIANIGVDRFIPVVEGCVYRHSGKEIATNAEEGIVMLADSMDNDEERVREADLIDVVKNDPNPIEYISCNNIQHPVDIVPGTGAKKFEIVFRLKGEAGLYHVREIIEVLHNSGLEKLIAIAVYPPKQEEKRIV